MIRRVPLLSALAALALFPGPGSAASPDRYRVRIQAVFTRAGNPLLVANFSGGNRAARPAWSVCRPPDTTVCTPAHRRMLLQPGRVPVGTVFQATATVPARYAGRYLFAFEERIPRDAVVAEPLYSRPSVIQPLHTCHTVARSTPGVLVGA